MQQSHDEHHSVRDAYSRLRSTPIGGALVHSPRLVRTYKRSTNRTCVVGWGIVDMLRAKGLYAIVDPECCLGRAPLEIARAILDGGCAVMQLRSKVLEPAERRALARQMQTLCSARGVTFIVNDDPVLAAELGASGVHLGQTDMPVREARKVVGPTLSIGLSTHNLEQARAAVQDGADVIGFGPVFTTQSKQNPDPTVGLGQLEAVCRSAAVPVIAIGGITLSNVAQVVRCGPAMVAAIGALCGANAPARAAASLHAASLQTSLP